MWAREQGAEIAERIAVYPVGTLEEMLKVLIEIQAKKRPLTALYMTSRTASFSTGFDP